MIFPYNYPLLLPLLLLMHALVLSMRYPKGKLKKFWCIEYKIDSTLYSHRAKMEIGTEEENNPIKQDIKNNELRYVDVYNI